MRRAFTVSFAVCLLIGLTTAAGASTNEIEAADCVIQPEKDPAALKPTPERAKSQRAKEAVGRRINKEFTRFGPANPFGQLDRGYIGGVADHNDRVVIVVDPKRVDKEQFRAEAARTAADARGVDPENVAPLEVTVQDGCFTADELLEAMRVLLDRDWHPRAKQVSLLFYLDPHDSTFHVALEDAEVAAALKERLGDRVTLSEGRVENAAGAGSTRRDDRNAHYGGAPMTRAGAAYGAASFCSAGFTVDKGLLFPTGSSGTRGMLTAGHCYDDGEGNVYAGHATGTGSAQTLRRFGRPFGELASPLHEVTDGTVITNVSGFTGATYTNRIYTNARLNLSSLPTDTTTPSFLAIESKAVVSKLDVIPLVSDLVCYSGRVSANICNNAVFPTPLTFCDQLPPSLEEGCVVGVRSTEQLSGYQSVAGGDSGGPVYVCVTNGSDILPNSQLDIGCVTSTDSASAMGTIVGKVPTAIRPDFGGAANGVFQPIIDQELAYNVVLATTP